MLDLRRHQTDLHWYLRQLEQVVLDVMADFDLVGERIPGLTGIWLEGRKVAAIGTGCRRWITQHGLALNVSCELNGFELITPCGLTGRRVARLVRLAARADGGTGSAAAAGCLAAGGLIWSGAAEA